MARACSPRGRGDSPRSPLPDPPSLGLVRAEYPTLRFAASEDLKPITGSRRVRLARVASRFHSSFSLVGNDYTFLQHELEQSYILDVLQRIAAHHDQIGQLADLDRAKIVAHAADRRTMSGRCDERLPRCGAIANPQSQFEQCSILERPNVRTQCHLDAGLERLCEPVTMNVRRRVRAAAQRMRHVALLDPALLPIVVRLVGGEVADREGRYVPGVMFQEEL